MTYDHEDLGIIVYAPALLGDEGRPLSIIYGMERTLPGLILGWTASEQEDFVALPRRDEWVMSNSEGGRLPFLCNNDDGHLVTVAGWENPNGLSAGSPPHFEVHADLPLDAAAISAAVDVLEAVAESARAFWGHATPSNAAVEISRQTRDPSRKPGIPPRGLPVLRFSEYIRCPEIPHYLGWLNYWSEAAARALGFPDAARDAEWLSRARRTASGGWVVQLTEAPLDLDNPEHLNTLKRAYEHFPEIGGRSTP